MAVLNEEQVKFILDDIRRNGIEMEDLQLSLLDHICCVIETEMLPEKNFEEFYQSILPRFFRRELREIQDETTLLLTFKNYYAMKKIMLNSGIFSAFMFLIGSLFKIMHWPGAGFILLTSIVIFSIVFLPLLSILRVKEQKQTKDKVVIAVATIFGILISIATLFKVMHWPGANFMWLTSLAILFFVFIPIYFFGGIRNPETKTNTIISSILILLAGGLLFTLTNLKSSRWTEESVYNSDDHLREAYMFIGDQNQLEYAASNDSTQIAEKQLQLKTNELCQKIELIKSSLFNQLVEKGISESQIIRHEGNNYSAAEIVLYSNNGKPSIELKKLKSEVNDYKSFITANFKLDNISILNTQDLDLYGDPALGKISWEENNFSHLSLAMTLRNLNQLLLNIRIVEATQI
jgi:hypothetical protein